MIADIGQNCCGISRLLIHKSVYDNFLNELNHAKYIPAHYRLYYSKLFVFMVVTLSHFTQDISGSTKGFLKFKNFNLLFHFFYFCFM